MIAARAARAQDEADPSQSSARQSLRVLLGRGRVARVSTRSFTFEGSLYRGTFERTADGQIVNVVALEEYLYSVVASQMSPGWPHAALEAQSVCARTYVLQRSDPRRSYDVIPSELDQLYSGIAAETRSAIAAVHSTAGKVISFSSEFAQVAYSSCCGGHTESASDAWGVPPVPYLSGVACGWCAGSPNFRWDRSLAFDDLAERLSLYGNLEDVQIAQRDASGRARTLDLHTDRGTTIVTGSAFRRTIGMHVLPSLLITSIERTLGAGTITFQGGGFGHGVGLCQWGARGMALQRRSWPEILAWYFPGTDIQNLT